MDHFLDWFLTVFHLVLIAFNLVGWIWKRTRKAHLAVMGLTILSWTVLGLRFGFGYCPCTDWHWAVKRRLGESGLPNSFVKYTTDSLTGLDWDAGLVDATVAAAGLLALAASVALTWRDARRRPRSGR